MKFVTPQLNESAFNCAFCGAYAHMNWYSFARDYAPRPYREAECSHCQESSLWRVLEYASDHFGSSIPSQGVMIYPDTGSAPLPDTDMPSDVKADYQEAASIFSKSPRGAAALLRLALQKLCKHLGKAGKDINSDIRELAKDNILPPLVIKVADTVRITGNNAVHPGEMSDEDFDYVASKLFDLLNFIVKKAITEPNELDELYNKTPEKPREAAEKVDAKNHRLE